MERLSPLDLAFWRIESARHPMHLGALALFTADGPGAAARAARLLAERSAHVPGLRRRIQDVLLPVGAAAWTSDPGFDPADHVRLLPGRHPDPHRTAGPLMARPLDRGRPPWEAHVMEGADEGSFAVLFKFHHALTDGLGALALAARLFDGDEAGASGGGAPGGGSSAAAPSAVASGRARSGSGSGAGSASGSGAGSFVGWPVPDLRRLPGTLLARVQDRVQDLGQALEIGAAVARSGLPIGVPDGLTTPPGAAGERSTAGVTLCLDDVHRVRKAAGGTVNDVLIALVAGALRRWLAERGDRVTGPGPRALVPVSRRRPKGKGAGGAGNRLSGYLVRLPLAEPDPLGRLGAVRADMDRNKEAGPHRGAGAVALLADHVPPLGHRLGGPLVAQAARLLYDVLVTSVPLPGLTFTLGGATLREVHPLAPLAQGQALAVAVSTYKGAVHYGLVADSAAVPDLDDLARALREELDGLLRAADGAAVGVVGRA
ncbi:wax ester/triacylglycerol synthase family O-acyltransferase [Streptomyces sp. NRRL S-87]|uniref:wax ester/triacylglycerol synthase family O-acyltransferase n=1 Tax=Streptomyces sp. NRRL S-87 TaxID=1463920 RepID=UPI0007C55239|nr:wax ester/triacylglycerol synthase family O-acyltransferase [Streptomyces sp. NRRL S-87]